MNDTSSVFISYSRQDREIARRLARDLSMRSIRVWFDQDEIRPGDSIIERLQEGLREVDYLIVLISRSSLTSNWMKLELESAFERNPQGTGRRVILVRLDDTEMPIAIRNIRYVNLYSDYEAGLGELLQRLEYDRTDQPKVDEVVDVPLLAKDLGAEKTITRGAEFYVTTVIGILTVVATLIGAVPALLSVLGNRPRIYYTVARYGLSVPPSIDGREIRRLIQEKGLADSTLQLVLMNKGDAKANDTELGTQVNGTIASISTEPAAESNPVWVQIATAPIKQNDHSGRVTLRDLVPGKAVNVSVQYHSLGPEYSADVVANGQLATKVSDLSAVPSWSPFEEFKTPLIVLGIGLLVSLLAGLSVAVARNPRLRSQVIDILGVISPISEKIIRALTKL